jgi:hypothetical protein
MGQSNWHVAKKNKNKELGRSKAPCFYSFQVWGAGRIGSNKYGEYKMQFAVHKSQATIQTCRQITITGDAEIHVREKPDQSY